MVNNKLMIVDGNSILNRAFYGLQGSKLLATADGLFTNAVFGFINILNKYLDEEKPEYLCVAFDLKAPTFRHKEYEGYKANRKGMPNELAVQVPVIKDVLDAMSIKRLEYEGYEADDIIGAVSHCAEGRGLDVIIITGDRDSLQLATERTRIKIPTTKAWKTETEEYDYDKVMERYGVTPKGFIDVKGLMGDKSDNIPGVPGIGEKTAIDLIKKFGSIEDLYQNLDRVEKAGVREKLSSNRELAFMSKRLATIERSIPEVCNLEYIDELKRTDFDRERLYELFKRLEFKSFIEKYDLAPRKVMEVMPSKQVGRIKSTEELNNLKEKVLSKKEFALYYLLDKADNFNSCLVGMGITSEESSVYIELGGSLTEDEFLNEFKGIFEEAGIKKFGHDMKNFIVYLKNKGIGLKGLAFDTMIGAYILNPSRETYDIAELAGEYLGINIEPVQELTGKGKSFTPFGNLPAERVSAAAGTYSDVVLKAKTVIEDRLAENQQLSLYREIELPLVEVLADIEHVGFKVNTEDLKSFSAELESRINLLINEIYFMAGEEFNINSTKQLGVILFEKLKLPVIKKTKTGYSTDAEVLEQLEPMHEMVAKLLEYRQLVKLKSTYVEGLLNVLNPKTGRIHSSFNQTVTVTGRISSTEPNLQNIPVKLEMGRKIRKVFVPENEEYSLVGGDYSQIELRVLAHITGDENMIAAFKNNEDIHTSTASKVFNVPREEVTSLLRSRAKAVNFGIVYGIGDFSLSKDLGITRKEARKYIDEYLNEYNKVKQYMHDIVQQGKEMGFVTTLFSRRRYLPELKSSNFNIRSFGERIAMNTPIQGSAADIIKIAMVNVYRELKNRNLKSRLILQVHDELIIETYNEEKAEVASILKDGMENAASLAVPLLVDVKSGHNWFELK